ncbi:DUF4145 domain-containing protein [Sporosarcina thermotolerans]|uniref:DUF4145 domain-containing protein n=1 Tax=Sporosarcina thermotolerans TaxID=633404 RepID=A0AAW9A5K1_9BACL|nr:DUF4145 domain-containing protein [Sporosarcina thermotolerans]MDW0116502.1 DUF4145 domain-containing protein [Sporosarcina thermotolerans]WHT48730.1 DUF4145 domain-containing protein [Sporosarcina thermotolerans]
MENNIDEWSPMRSLDKILFWMGMPFILVMLMALFVDWDQFAQNTLFLFLGHSFLLLFMIGEKKLRLENERSQTLIFFAWLLFGFGLACFLWNVVIGAIAGLIVAILAIKWKLTTNSISFLLWIGWILNMYASFTSPVGFMDKLIFLFSPNVWQANVLKLGLVTLVSILILAVASITGAKNQQEQKKTSSNNMIDPELKENPHRVSLISDREAIKKIHKGLEEVAQRLNMNLTSDATTRLRLVSEEFTKQISIHNNLSLEKIEQYRRIKYLYDKEYISNELYHLLSTIRTLGNKAAHELGDDDRFNKNGLLKLRHQFLEHLNEWVIHDQNEVAAAPEDDFASDSEFEQMFDYEADKYESLYDEVKYKKGDEVIDEDEDDEDDECRDDYFDQDDYAGIKEEDEKIPQRSSNPIVLPKEIREKMKF